MRIDASQQTTATRVTGAIQQAAKATGTSFQYLLATAKVESNLNPDAAAKTSSAGGLFQFIEQTWLGTMKEAGASLGYGRYANAITKSDSGRYTVSDPAMRAEILQLRQDPTANAVMAGALTKSNAAVLKQKLGRQPTDGELYIAHFLGAKGAAALIGQSEQAPDTRASSIFPEAARANRSIFFNRDGRPRNVAEVSETLSNRFQVALAKQPANLAVAQVAPADNVAPTVTASATTATRAVARTNPLSIPGAALPIPGAAVATLSPPPPVPGGIPISPATLRAAQSTDNTVPVTPGANARVARAYEILSPNMVRSLSAPVSPTSVPDVQAAAQTSTSTAAATPPVAPTVLASAVNQRAKASLDGEPVYSNPYRAAERREPIAPAVKDLWAEAAANAARARALAGTAAPVDIQKPAQRMASVAPEIAPAATQPAPQTATAKPPAASSNEPLGLFQDARPNVRALFTGG